MLWQIRIQDPSGETRIQPINGAATIGKGSSSTIILRDPTAPMEAAQLFPKPSIQKNASPFWLKTNEQAPPCILGDIAVRDCQIPAGLPFNIGESRLTVEPVASENTLPTQPHQVRHWLTRSEEGKKTLWLTKKAAATPLSIYLAGETGTGKEVLAHLIHAWSDRAAGPFVPLHCGALPLSLAESELFGHTKGAFTGAINHRPGALMQAHNGTLFLDEIGDLPLDIQVKLLRFLEDGEIRAVGADHPSRADVRLLCATHQPLLKLVEEGKFRRDLYYRLASVTIEIPTLRSRPEDIAMLAHRFASDLNRMISQKAMLRLQAHAWPGNVRELRHAIERASGLAGPFTSVLDENAFEFLLSHDAVKSNPSMELGGSILTLKEMERAMILKALKLSRGNRAKAAKILGVARSTLFEMLKRHRIHGPRAKDVALDELLLASQAA